MPVSQLFKEIQSPKNLIGSNIIIEYKFTLLNVSNTNQPSVLSLLGTSRFKDTAGSIFSHPIRDGLSHGVTAKAMHEVTVLTKVKYKQCRLLLAFSCLSPPILLTDLFSISMS